MLESFEDVVTTLAKLADVDARQVILDEHARWRLYQDGLADASQRTAVLQALRVDPNSPLVSAAVIRAFELVSSDERAAWLDVLPPGRQHDYARRRMMELGLLENLLDDANAQVDEVDVRAWSPWLQLRLAEQAANRDVLQLLSEEGGTKRIKNLARQRLRST